MENLKIVLAGPGLGLEHVLQGIYLTRLEDDDARVNAVCAGYFPADRRLVRTVRR